MSATSRRATKAGGKKSSGKNRADENEIKKLMERLQQLSEDPAEVNTEAKPHSEARGPSSAAIVSEKVKSEVSVPSKVRSEVVEPASSISAGLQFTSSIPSDSQLASSSSSGSQLSSTIAAHVDTHGKECSDDWEVASNASSDICCAPRAHNLVVEEAAIPKLRSDAWEISSTASSDICCAPSARRLSLAVEEEPIPRVRSDAWDVRSTASSDICCAPRARSLAREVPTLDLEYESSDSSSSTSSSGLPSSRSASPVPSCSTPSASSSDSESDADIEDKAIAVNCISPVEAKVGTSPRAALTSNSGAPSNSNSGAMIKQLQIVEPPPIQHIYPISCSWPLFDINECSKEIEEEITQMESSYAAKNKATSDAVESFALDIKPLEPEPEEQMDIPEMKASSTIGKPRGIMNNLMNQEFETRTREAEDLRIHLARATYTLESANDLMAKMSCEKDALAMWWEDGPPLSPTSADDLDQWFQDEQQC